MDMNKMRGEGKWDLADIPKADGEGEFTTIDHEGIVHVTAKGVLVKIDGEKKWLPREHVFEITNDTVDVAMWLAESEGWE